jgi:hypothetical protein
MGEVFGEFPFDNIVDCHFGGGEFPTGCKNDPPPAILCRNTYGGGNQYTHTDSQPYGPFSGAQPWAGTINAVAENGPPKPNGQPGLYGGFGHPYVDSNGNLIASTVSVPAGGALPAGLTFDGNQLFFTTRFLIGPEFPTQELWVVPMAEGSVCYRFPTQSGRILRGSDPPVAEIVGQYFPIPVVVATYKIHCEWECFHCDPGDEIGFDLIAPIQNATSISPHVITPAVPTFGPFPRSGGTWDYTYQYKWNTWFGVGIAGADNFLTRVVNDANKTDLSYGGPRFVYSHARRRQGIWEPSDNAELGYQALLGENDWFTWEITSECVNEKDACCRPADATDSFVVNGPPGADDIGTKSGPI